MTTPLPLLFARTFSLLLLLGLLITLRLSAEESQPGAEVTELLKAAQAGQAGSMYQLALAYGYGKGVERDLEQAAHWLMLAVAQGQPDALKKLDVFDFYPGMARADALKKITSKEGLAELTIAAERGELEAQFALGLHREITDKAVKAAWLAKAAAQLHRPAMYTIGWLHGYEDVPRNFVQAHGWYARAALLGDRGAKARLGEMYFWGNNGTKDASLAKFLYLEAAAGAPADDLTAQIALAGAKAITVAPATAEVALRHLRSAAKLAVLPGAQPATPVAVAAAVPPLAPPKPAPAAAPKVLTLDDHRAAAAAGNVESMYQLGLADIERRQIESNKQTGPYSNDPQRNATDFRWIMSAARAGHPGAQFLAATHWLSAETDAGKKTWLEKAAAQGHATAKDTTAVGKISAEAAEAKAAAEDEKLANEADPEAAFRALRRRIGRSAKAITDNFLTRQRGQPVTGPTPEMGHLDGDMVRWADHLMGAGHAAGTVLIYQWCFDTNAPRAYLALLLRRELAALDPDLALKEGASGIDSPAGWAKAEALLQAKLTPAMRTEIEGTATRLFTGPDWLVAYGVNFFKGRCGFPQDYGQAVRLYKKAADAGSPVAHYNLATCYWSGQGVPRDRLAAYDLMKTAVALGYTKAEQSLASAEKDPEFARMLAARASQPGGAAPVSGAVQASPAKELTPTEREAHAQSQADLSARQQQNQTQRDLINSAASPPATPPAAPVLDGKVAALNPGTFAALQRIKNWNPGPLTEEDSKELRKAILADDGKVDEAERDLLAELIQSQFRSIQVRAAGAKAEATPVVLYPVLGNTKKVLSELLQRKPDFEVK